MSLAKKAGGALLALTLSACITNNAQLLTKKQATTGLTAENPLAGGSSDSSGSFLTLKSVVRSNTDPRTYLELIGDGSGSIGTYCSSSGSGGGSACTCEFDYIKPDGAQESFRAPVSYQEENLLRCAYTAVPTAGLSYMNVRIHVTASDSYSNSVAFRFTGSTVELDTSDSASFAKVQRYQCRDYVTIPYLFDSGIYDPIQSEDPSITYPLNYYTTNLGGSISQFVGNKNANPTNGAGFNCPSNPAVEDTDLDYSIFSVRADEAGSKKIYPVAGSRNDRFNFHLAKSRTGIFTKAVNAYIAPQTNTSEGEGTPPPIGYGAEPIPRGGDQEDCPSDAAIPEGYKWVKVWLFRASLDDRKARDSAKIRGMGAIACNPGKWTQNLSGGGDPGPVITDCGSTGGTTAVANGDTLADRVITGSEACVRLNNNPGGLCSSNSSKGAGCVSKNYSAGSIFTAFDKRSDIWQILPNGSNDECSSDKKKKANLCDPTVNTQVAAGSSHRIAVPNDANPDLLSVDGEVSRYDYLFVVTPTDIMTKNFKEGDNKSLPYTPYRFYVKGQCNSPDPDNPLAAGDCASKNIVRYGIKLHDIGFNGDAPDGQPGRLPVFPVCALQPK